MFSALTIKLERDGETSIRTVALADAARVSIRTEGNVARIWATNVVDRPAPIVLDIVDPTTFLEDGILDLVGTTPGGDPVKVSFVLV